MDIKQTYSLDMYILYLSFLDFDSKYIEELANIKTQVTVYADLVLNKNIYNNINLKQS